MNRIPRFIKTLLLAELAAGLVLCALLLKGLTQPQPLAPVAPAAPATAAAPVAPAKHTAALILCYHSIVKKSDSPYAVPKKTFAAQMDWLARRGYRVVALTELIRLLDTHDSLPDSLVAITFDDGYKTVYTNAWPILKRHGFPFSVFIYPGFIGTGCFSLSWAQLSEMAAAGVEIGSHSMTHPLLTRRGGRSQKSHRQWLLRELQGSKDTIEARLGRPARFLAYPYGAFDRSVEEAAKAAGYEACLLVNAGVNDTTTSPYNIDRVIVSRRITRPLFGDIFKKRSLELSDITPCQGEEVAPSRNLDISARIRRLGGLDPASIIMKVSRSQGAAVIDTVTGLARFVLDKPLRKGFHEAAIYAKNRSGQQCLGCWMFLVR